ncbi:phage holin family protein [Micromonospora coerulea]|uniref:phage holin family protein n=1 Tax=Micromonospora coerulea TaxID=47856 RepID=UPI0019061826|nr:phage holin family protein [Micromonospora veneta]
MDDVSKGARPAAGAGEEVPVAQLVQRAMEQITQLVRDELTLARAELTAKGRHAGAGAAMFASAGGVAVYGGAALAATVILILAEIMPAWVAALVVAVILFAVAGLLALSGKKRTQQTMPLKPESTLTSVREDVESVRQAAKEGRKQ